MKATILRVKQIGQDLHIRVKFESEEEMKVEDGKVVPREFSEEQNVALPAGASSDDVKMAVAKAKKALEATLPSRKEVESLVGAELELPEVPEESEATEELDPASE